MATQRRRTLLLCLLIGSSDAFSFAPGRHAGGRLSSSKMAFTRKPTVTTTPTSLFVSRSDPARLSIGIDSDMNARFNSTGHDQDMVDNFHMQFTEFARFNDRETAKSTTSSGRQLQQVPIEYDDDAEMYASAMESSSSTSLATTDSMTENEGLSDIWKARLLLLASAALYGTNFSLVKILGDTMPVGISSTLRFGLAALATSPWLVWDWKKDESLQALWLGLEVGMWASVGYVAQAVGLETTPASESAFICSLAVVTVPLLDVATGKRLKTKEVIGALAAVVGVALLELGGGDIAHGLSYGDICSLIQPLAFGLGFWRMEAAMQRFPEQASRTTAAQLLAVFAASAAYGAWSLDMSTLGTAYPWMEWMNNPSILFSLFWTGVITTAATVYMETLALKTLSAAETTLIFSTEPLWGTAFAAAVMGEQLGWDAAIGGVLILAGCLYSNLGLSGIQGIFRQKQRETDHHVYQPLLRDLPAHVNKQWAWLTSAKIVNDRRE